MSRDLLTRIRALVRLRQPGFLAWKLANFSVNWLERKMGRTYLRSMPLGADIVTTRRCNCRCVMCIGYASRPPVEMPLELFDEIAGRLFPTLLYVRFASGGEHFLHPHFRRMLSTCRRYGCPVTIVSNGTLIDSEWAEFLVRESSVWSLIISFDGARLETFNSIRRGALFDHVLQNVCRIGEAQRRSGSAFPVLSLRFVAMRRNVEELPMLVRLASEIGVGQVQVAYLTVAPGFEQDESLWHHQSLATRVFDEARVVAKERNIDLRLPPSFADAAYGGEAGCVLPWTQLYIDPSGSLRLCCNAWDDFPPLGDFSAVNFRRVWNNDRYVELRASMLRGRPVYARCHNCPALARDPSRKEMHFL